MFDPPEMVPYAQTPDSEIDSYVHRTLALKAAQESMVLLKNDGTLPLRPDIRKIAVFGPLAESITVLHGNYAGTASHATTALAGIRAQFASAEVSFHPGMNFLRDPTVVPTTVLSTEDGQPGLKAEYFASDNFSVTPQVVRVDSKVDLQLSHPDSSAVAPPEGVKEFSVRWSGFLTPTESGNYQIGLVGSMNRLWLDGQLIVDDALLHDSIPTLKTVQLEKGHRYALKVEFLRGGFGTKLVWLHLISGSDCRSCSCRAASRYLNCGGRHHLAT